jgi:hypothetical protein
MLLILIFYHSSSYVINLAATDSLLTIEIELVDTCDRWSGEFSLQCKYFSVYRINGFND